VATILARMMAPRDMRVLFAENVSRAIRAVALSGVDVSAQAFRADLIEGARLFEKEIKARLRGKPF
jgi:hypothetical protein